MPEYSVLMSVYYLEQPDFLLAAVASMFGQTIPPAELVLVCDGPLSEALDQTIDALQRQYPARFRVLRLSTHVGLGCALQQGVLACRHEWIARMDSDDISVPDRMEKLLAQVAADPRVSVIGGQILEFESDPHLPVAMRCVPLEPADIRKTLTYKNPMNHVTTLLHKPDIIAAGNYQSFPGFEDYHLWARLLAKGYRLRNLEDTLCLVRIGADTYRRRSGWGYCRNTVKLQWMLLRQHQISFLQFSRNLLVRLSASLMPNALRGVAFRLLMRNQVPYKQVHPEGGLL